MVAPALTLAGHLSLIAIMRALPVFPSGILSALVVSLSAAHPWARLWAQSSVTIDVPSGVLTRPGIAECRFTASRRYANNVALNKAKDTITINFFTTAEFKDKAAIPGPFLIKLNDFVADTVDPDAIKKKGQEVTQAGVSAPAAGNKGKDTTAQKRAPDTQANNAKTDTGAGKSRAAPTSGRPDSVTTPGGGGGNRSDSSKTNAAAIQPYTLPMEPMTLADRVVTLWGLDAKSPFCAGAPLPRVVLGSVPPYESHTDFTASGEVNDALNTGAAGGAATGSLGVHFVSYAREGRDTTGFFDIVGFFVDPIVHAFGAKNFHVWSPSVGLEEVRAAISVAGTSDSVTNTARGDFAEALLIPLTAAHGRGSSLQLEYSPLHAYGDSHQRIGLFGRFVANRSRWNPEVSTGARVGKDATVIAGDLRARWIAINHESPSDGNNFSLSVDAGWTNRYIMGDAARDSTKASDVDLVVRAIGKHRTRFNGYTTGVSLTLRQVTAFADLNCLSCDLGLLGIRSRVKSEDRIDGLEGFQPVIGFRFEAPFFSLGGRE